MAASSSSASTTSETQIQFGGFPVEIFEEGFDAKFKCGICEKILRDPRQNFCGHRFCMNCLRHIFRNICIFPCKLEEETRKRGGKAMICPHCVEEGTDAEELSLSQIFPDNAVKREMTKMNTRCPNPGCSWKGKFRDYLETHEKGCDHRPQPCPHCSTVIPLSRQADHEQKECSQRKTACKNCNMEIPFADTETHNAVCPKFPMKCDACGKKKIPREQLQDHLDRECNKRMLTCPVGCPDQMNLDKFIQHLTLNKNTGTHLFYVLDKLMQLEHRVTNGVGPMTSQGDLSSVMASINELDRKIQEIQTHAQPNEETHANARIAATEAKVTAFEPIMGVLHKEIERCLQVIEALERQQIAERQRSDQLAAMVETMDTKIKAFERTIALKDIQLAEHDLRMQCMELASYDGSLLWRITDFTKKRQEAVTGKVTSLYSPAFFTGKVGYKMCARIYLNGDGMGKGTHISLFFVVMRGHFDALMPWPFQQKVTLMMIDQNFKEHMVDTFRPDPSSSSFRRPASEMNIASGCPLFLPLGRLTDPSLGYVKDDVMFVKILVDNENLDRYTELNPLRGSLPNLPPQGKSSK